MELIIYQNRTEPSDEYLQFQDYLLDSELRYRALDLLNNEFKSPGELLSAIRRSVQICKTAGISVRRNFKPIYVTSERGVVCDWKISSLARKLIILNGDPDKPFVARAQLELLGEL